MAPLIERQPRQLPSESIRVADAKPAKGQAFGARDGRLYAATRLGVRVCDQPGRVQGILPRPNGKISNLCFGGENFGTLFATCGDKVFKRKLKVWGEQPWAAPNKPATPGM